MNFFSKLFGLSAKSSAKKRVEPFEYKGFLILPNAQAESGQYRVSGSITKEVNGEIKEHTFIRSDVVALENDANTLMLTKAKMFIDQMGNNIF